MSANQQELEKACKANDIARVSELLATTPLNERDAAVRSCIRSPSLPLMRCLLEHGADASRYPWVQIPPSLDMVKLFVEFGYDVKAEGHKILQDFAHDREALDWLMDHGADPNRTDDSRDDEYPPRRLIGARDYSLKVLNLVAASGDMELFDRLVSRGADPQRSMALHRASRCPDPDKTVAMIDHLLDKHHMDIEANNQDFRRTVDSIDAGTPLDNAVYHRNLAAVKHLIKRGAQLRGAADQSVGRWGLYPFLPALGPLLDAGADPDSALELVIRINDIEAARLCVKAGADPRAIIDSQEARAARLVARPERNSDDEEEYYDDEYLLEDERNAEWSNEMETFLRSCDYVS